MSNIKLNIEGEIISFLFILSSFILSIPFYKINPEYSRKVIHIMLGNFYFIALFYFTEWYFACFGPFVFIFVNYFSVKYRYIKLMLRHNKKDEKGKIYNDYGTVYYAISLTIITMYSWKIKRPEMGIGPFLSMAFGDGFACIMGSNIKSPYKIIFGAKKSLIGCLTMFFMCFLIYKIFFWYFNINAGFIKAFFLGIISMILEAVSPYSTDNLTVPIANLVIMSFIY